MLSRYIHYEHSEIHYLYHGSGTINVICLHGYGESAASFGSLKEYLPAEFLLIAIDLPFHGTTKWNEGRVFTTADLVHILEAIFKELNLYQQHFILMGYSMGGRIAMSLLQQMPEKISRLILLAPDGMKVNFWYWLSTQTNVGNRIFQFTMNRPGWLLNLLNILDRFSLINKSVFKFIITYINDENVRKQLFNRWTCMRTFTPDHKKLRTIIQRKQLPVRMLYGGHDRIILAKRAGKFIEGIESCCEISIIDAGHQVLHQKHAGIITKLLTT